MDDDRSCFVSWSQFSHTHSTHTYNTYIVYEMKRTTKVITIGIITIGRVET